MTNVNAFKRCAARLGLLAALSAVLAGPVQAVPVVYAGTFNFGYISSATETQFSPQSPFYDITLQANRPDIQLPRFDASLGTLESVSITFESFYSHRVSVFATDDFAEITNFTSCNIIIIIPCNYQNDAFVSTIYNSSLSLELVGTPVASTLNVGEQQVFCSASTDRNESAECQDTSSLFGFYNGSLDISGLSLASFIGSNPLEFSFSTSYSLFGNCDHDDHDDSCIIQSRLPWVGSLFVTYEYSETAPVGGGGEGGGGNSGQPTTSVPEPASFGLLLGGFFLLAAQRVFKPRGNSVLTFAARAKIQKTSAQEHPVSEWQ